MERGLSLSHGETETLHGGIAVGTEVNRDPAQPAAFAPARSKLYTEIRREIRGWRRRFLGGLRASHATDQAAWPGRIKVGDAAKHLDQI